MDGTWRQRMKVAMVVVVVALALTNTPAGAQDTCKAPMASIWILIPSVAEE